MSTCQGIVCGGGVRARARHSHFRVPTNWGKSACCQNIKYCRCMQSCACTEKAEETPATRGTPFLKTLQDFSERLIDFCLCHRWQKNLFMQVDLHKLFLMNSSVCLMGFTVTFYSPRASWRTISFAEKRQTLEQQIDPPGGFFFLKAGRRVITCTLRFLGCVLPLNKAQNSGSGL